MQREMQLALPRFPPRPERPPALSYFRGISLPLTRFRLPPRGNPFRGWTIFMGDDGDRCGNSGRRGGSAG